MTRIESFLRKTWMIGLTLLLSIITFLFWGSHYSAHLAYQEQFQLFLLDTDYWWERVAIPGGVADYIAEYLTQFYYLAWVGAFILALLFVTLQLLVWKLFKRQGAASFYYPLSFIPVVVLWHFMGNENVMLSFLIALLLTLITAWAYTYIESKWRKAYFVLLTLPLLYWAAGPVHFILVGWVIVREGLNCLKERNIFGAVSLCLVVGVLGLVIPLLASLWVQYPLARLMEGIGYYRLPAEGAWMEIGMAMLLTLLPFIVAGLPKPKKKTLLVATIQAVIIVCGGYYLVTSGCNMAKEEALEYDRMVRNKEWLEIIEKAEKNPPTSPFCVTYLNLALGKTGQLGNRMFEFYQNGTEGLLPEFQRDFTSPLPAGEVYYYLGMINTAERFTFEAMEAIPNFRKSVRCYKRLAETNLINGQYAVAAKYLRALQKTMFYKDWAEDALTYLQNEAKINAHQEWGVLRKYCYQEDFLFNNGDIDGMLAVLYQHNLENRMAFEYLLAYALQNIDIERFMRYYPMGKDLEYKHLPNSHQQALVYAWTQNHSSFENMPWNISPQTIKDVTQFAQIYTSQKEAQQTLSTHYGNTFWYYMLYKK